MTRVSHQFKFLHARNEAHDVIRVEGIGGGGMLPRTLLCGSLLDEVTEADPESVRRPSEFDGNSYDDRDGLPLFADCKRERDIPYL